MFPLCIKVSLENADRGRGERLSMRTPLGPASMPFLHFPFVGFHVVLLPASTGLETSPSSQSMQGLVAATCLLPYATALSPPLIMLNILLHLT